MSDIVIVESIFFIEHSCEAKFLQYKVQEFAIL